MTDTDATSGNSMEPFGRRARQIPKARRTAQAQIAAQAQRTVNLQSLINEGTTWTT